MAGEGGKGEVSRAARARVPAMGDVCLHSQLPHHATSTGIAWGTGPCYVNQLPAPSAAPSQSLWSSAH